MGVWWWKGTGAWCKGHVPTTFIVRNAPGSISRGSLAWCGGAGLELGLGLELELGVGLGLGFAPGSISRGSLARWGVLSQYIRKPRPLAFIRNRRLNSVALLNPLYITALALLNPLRSVQFISFHFISFQFSSVQFSSFLTPYTRYWCTLQVKVGSTHTAHLPMRPNHRANSSVSPMRPPCYPFLKELDILGVIYGSVVKVDGTHTARARIPWSSWACKINTTWFTFLYPAGFEACLGWNPRHQSCWDPKAKHTSQIQMLRHFSKKKSE